MSQLIVCKVLPGAVIEDAGDFAGDDGKEVKWTTRKQEAVLTVGDFSYPYRVRLEGTQPPYEPGLYHLDMAQMLQVNKKTHSLTKFTRLLPVAAGK